MYRTTKNKYHSLASQKVYTVITRKPIFPRQVEVKGFISSVRKRLSTGAYQDLGASGVKWNLQRIDTYECYDNVCWQIQLKADDVLACYLVHSPMNGFRKLCKTLCIYRPNQVL